MCPLSNVLGFVEFWYAKRKWWKFSQDVLILGLFRRSNLYRMPRVTVLSSILENGIRKNFNLYPNHSNRYHLIWCSLDSSIHVLSQTLVWDRFFFGLVTNPNLHKVYLQNYSEPRDEIFTESSSIYTLFPNQILDPKPSPKKFYIENAKMTSFKQPNPRTILLWYQMLWTR